MVRGINNERSRYGLGPYAQPRLARAADYHSWDMLDGDFFAHTSRNGDSSTARAPLREPPRARRDAGDDGQLSGAAAHDRREHVDEFARPSRDPALAGFSRVGVAKRSGSLNGNPACLVTADFGSRR